MANNTSDEVWPSFMLTSPRPLILSTITPPCHSGGGVPGTTVGLTRGCQHHKIYIR